MRHVGYALFALVVVAVVVLAIIGAEGLFFSCYPAPPKFKLDDQVRVVSGFYSGREGTVRGTYDPFLFQTRRYMVKFDEYDYEHVDESDMTLRLPTCVEITEHNHKHVGKGCPDDCPLNGHTYVYPGHVYGKVLHPKFERGDSVRITCGPFAGAIWKVIDRRPTNGKGPEIEYFLQVKDGVPFGGWYSESILSSFRVDGMEFIELNPKRHPSPECLPVEVSK